MKEMEEREVAKKIGNIINQTLEKMEPICKQITEVSILISSARLILTSAAH
jgi:hypothetical protein